MFRWRLSVRIESGPMPIEKRVTLDLSRWIGKAVNDGLTTEQALSELRGRLVPWQAADTPAPQTRPASKRKGTTAGERKSSRA